MISFLLALIAVIGGLQLLTLLVVVVALRHGIAATEGVHLVADEIRTDLVADRNLKARWKG